MKAPGPQGRAFSFGLCASPSAGKLRRGVAGRRGIRVNDLLRKMLTGIGIRQEYLCVALEELADILSVRLATPASSDTLDVTGTHVFLGYRPLLLAIPFADADSPAARAAEVCLSFQAGAFAADTTWRGFPASSDSIARLHLKKIRERKVGDRLLAYYEGVFGAHRLLGAFHRFMNRWLEQFKQRPEGNVALDPNLYEQVRIAYSLPRIISLVSVGDGERMNLFPTDLHGPVDGAHYTSSLRIGGRACEQVEAGRRIVLSEIAAGAFQLAYRLGKNHMQPPRERSAFELQASPSAMLGLGLPAAVVRYRELEWFEHFDRGIHRVFMYRVLGEQRVADGPRLAHVHKCYAQWRADRGLSTRYLLRQRGS